MKPCLARQKICTPCSAACSWPFWPQRCSCRQSARAPKSLRWLRLPQAKSAPPPPPTVRASPLLVRHPSRCGLRPTPIRPSGLPSSPTATGAARTPLARSIRRFPAWPASLIFPWRAGSRRGWSLPKISSRLFKTTASPCLVPWAASHSALRRLSSFTDLCSWPWSTWTRSTIRARRSHSTASPTPRPRLRLSLTARS